MKRAALLAAFALGPLLIAPLWVACELPGTEAIVGLLVSSAMQGGKWALAALVPAVCLYALVVREVWGER